jgi:Protein of unknown function (DUF1569)
MKLLLRLNGSAGTVRTSGKHSFGQILNHLALSLDVSTGRVVAPPLMKRMVINSKPLKPGLKLPAKGEAFFWPDREFEVPAASTHLKVSVDYYNRNKPLPYHPSFGKLTKQEMDELNCRRAALHLSFVHPT